MHHIFILCRKSRQATQEKYDGNDDHDAKALRVCPSVSNKIDKHIFHYFCNSLEVYLTVISTSKCWI